MSTTSAAMLIDAVHARAICDEIGDRLRSMLLPREVNRGLPPRLRELMAHLTRLDDDDAPSIVPSLDDMTIPERTGTRLARSEELAVKGAGTDPGVLSNR
jgi:hypothetical protein